MGKFTPVIFSSLLLLSGCGGGSGSDSNTRPEDSDNDSIINSQDNCPNIANRDQLDSNNNGIGDACENIDNSQVALQKISEYARTTGTSSAPQVQDYIDAGVQGVDSTNLLKLNQAVAELSEADVDTLVEIQTVFDDLDIPVTPADDDSDGVLNTDDNCPLKANPNQVDSDNDGKGDICDNDIDNDGVVNSKDEFPNDPTRAASVTSAHRILNQATFGATEAQIDNIVKIGVDAWLNQQLSMPSAYDSSTDNHQTHYQRTAEITQTAEPSIPWIQSGYKFNSGEDLPFTVVRHYQMSAWWENVLGHPNKKKHGSDQLRQRIAYALSQILVASGKDPRLELRGDSLAYYYDLLAKNAFGNYRTLLGEVSRSATMGVYLTYQGNQKADPTKSTRPDENYARELIQLFTIGLAELNVDGSPNRDDDYNSYPDAGNHQVPTYTQTDVVELAKVMTGWDVEGNRYFGRTSMSKAEYAAPMVFHPEHHEDELAEGGDGNVTVLGKSFALNSGNDKSGLDAALDVIFQHPNIGPFISTNLIMNLVTSNPTSEYVARVAKVFNDNGQGVKGDLKAVITAILLDKEARETENQNQNFGKLKEPLLVFTQLLRSFNVTPLNGWKGRADDNRGDGSKATVNGVFSYVYPENDFGQAPLRSSSVFNFYQPDFVPSNNYFSDKGMVSPESQILTDGNILTSHNKIAQHMQRYEKNWINNISNQSLAEFAQNKSLYSTNIIVNYDREFTLFEQALDGDTNGDFSNMRNTTDRERAIDALLIHLDKIMLGNTMKADYRQKLKDYLLTAQSYNSSNTIRGAHYLISDTIRFIATSSAFLVQK